MAENAEIKKTWFLSVLNKMERPLMRYAKNFFHQNNEKAEDCVQFTFLQLWKQEMEKVREKVVPWCYRVCRNKAIDLFRLGQREVAFEFPEDEFISHFNVENDLAQKQLLGFFSKLDDESREVVLLKYRDGLSYKEIAEITGLKESNIGVLIHRGSSQLQKLMQAEEEKSL